MSNKINPGNLDSRFFNNYPGIHLKRFLFCLPVILIGLVLAAFLIPSALKRDSRKDVVIPVTSADKGFVGKSNVLFRDLLNNNETETSVNSLAGLNKRYPAFEFILPYPESEGSNLLDVRVADIHPEYISDDELKNFFYNSSLPSLLKKQRANVLEKYFTVSFRRVKVKKGVYEYRISRIELKPDMFRVALSKHMWMGTVKANGNSMFDKDDNIYLVHKDMVMPLSRVGSQYRHTVVFSLDDETFYSTAIDRYNKCFRPLDYYDYYKSAFHKEKEGKSLRIELKDSYAKRDSTIGWLDISYLNPDKDTPKILLRPNVNVVCYVASPGKELYEVKPSEYASNPGDTLEYHEGMRIMLYDRAKTKQTEFALVSDNPMLILSSMKYTEEGASRYWADKKNADVLTRQIARGVVRNASGIEGLDAVSLSVDPMLSLEFENEMRKYIKDKLKYENFKHIQNENYEMSVTIMDMATGEILASPSVTEKLFTKKEDDTLSEEDKDKYMMTMRNSSMVRRPIGSTFKPLLTLAAVLSNPSLNNLVTGPGKTQQLIERGDKKAGIPGRGKFLGRNTRSWVDNQWINTRNMTQYLGYSDDIYPVVMTALALSGKTDSDDLSEMKVLPYGDKSYFSNGGNDILLGNPNVKIDDYELIKNLASLYEVYSFHNSDMDPEQNLNYYLWRNLFEDNDYHEGLDRHFGLDEVSPDATNMRYDRFAGETLKGQLVPWILGQGDNDWSCIKMAEAWTRMISKKPVKASFVVSSSETDKKAEDLVDVISSAKAGSQSRMKESKINDTWNIFLDNFRKAQALGTLSPMNLAVTNLNKGVKPECGNLVVFSKTGTPDEYKRLETRQLADSDRHYDIAQFVFSLMSESSLKSVKGRGEAKGITCVVRITRSYNGTANDSGLWSWHARNFFSGDSDRLEKLYYMTQKYY